MSHKGRSTEAQGVAAGWAVRPVAPCLCADLLWLCCSSRDQSTSLRERWEGEADRSLVGRPPAQHPAHRTLPRGGCPQPGLAQLSSSDSSGGSSGTCWDLQVCRRPWRAACFLVSTQAGVPAASTPVPAPTRGRGEVEMPRPDVCKSTNCSWLAACVW